MALENIANEDMAVEFSLTSVDPSDAVYTGDPGIDLVKVVPTLSTKCKAASKKIGTVSIVVTWLLATGGCPYTSVLYNFVSGVATVPATAAKTKAESVLVLREGDTGTCVGGWTLKASPFTPVVCNCDVTISDAGQSKAKAQ